MPHLHMPHIHLPSVEDVRRRANEMFAHTPSMDEIVERARQLVVERVSAHLLRDGVTA